MTETETVRTLGYHGDGETGERVPRDHAGRGPEEAVDPDPCDDEHFSSVGHYFVISREMFETVKNRQSKERGEGAVRYGVLFVRNWGEGRDILNILN